MRVRAKMLLLLGVAFFAPLPFALRTIGSVRWLSSMQTLDLTQDPTWTLYLIANFAFNAFGWWVVVSGRRSLLEGQSQLIRGEPTFELARPWGREAVTTALVAESVISPDTEVVRATTAAVGAPAALLAVACAPLRGAPTERALPAAVAVALCFTLTALTNVIGLGALDNVLNRLHGNLAACCWVWLLVWLVVIGAPREARAWMLLSFPVAIAQVLLDRELSALSVGPFGAPYAFQVATAVCVGASVTLALRE